MDIYATRRPASRTSDTDIFCSLQPGGQGTARTRYARKIIGTSRTWAKTLIISMLASSGILGAVLVAPASPAGATPSPPTLYASPNGTASSGCATPPSSSSSDSDMCSLHNAITVAEGSAYSGIAVTILLEHTDGNLCSTSDTCTFSGTQSVSSGSEASLTIEGTGTGSGSSAYSVLDANGSGRAFTDSASFLVRLDNVTVTGGSIDATGGGIDNNIGATMTVTDSTISDNNAPLHGGGIFNNNGGTMTVTDSTISDNTAPYGGGGIFNFGSGPMTVAGTIVADQAAGGNCSGTVTDAGYNLSNGTSCFGSTPSGTGSISDATLDLGTLGNYGGPTQTVPLLGTPSTDQAIGAITPPATVSFTPPAPSIALARPQATSGGSSVELCSDTSYTTASGYVADLSLDQRGMARPSTGCSAGAYQYVPPPPIVSSISPSSGPTGGGTSVTMTGTNFSTTTGGTTIDFGAGNPATAASCSTTSSCTAISPAGSGTVNITATTTGGTSATSTADEFAYTTPPPPPFPFAPAITSVSPASGPAAGGTSVTITGTKFSTATGGTTIDFGSTPATAVSCSATSSCTAISPAGSGTVNVTATTTGGTSATSSADEFAYTTPATSTGYHPIAPTRICDTRSGNPSNLSGAEAQCNGHSLSANAPLQVQVTGLGAVPASGVSAVVLNVTATNEASSGYMTIYPGGSGIPATSNLNFLPGDPVAHLVEVGVGQNGQVSILSNATTDVVVDVEGYYLSSSATPTGLYNGVSPTRVCDTRSGNPSNLSGAEAQCNGHTLSANTPLQVQVTGLAAVPASGVSAVVLNLTATGFNSNGYVTLYPGGSGVPITSNLNFHTGEGPVTNEVIVPVTSTGSITIVSDTTTDVIIDVEGYFTSTSSTATGSQFTPEATPARILDTRCGVNPPPSACASENLPPANASIGTLGAATSVSVKVSGLGGVPTSAKAVVVNVTATDTTSNGFLSVNPASTPPETSNLNWTAGETVSNLVIATISASGAITIYNHSGSADVIVDVMGWYN